VKKLGIRLAALLINRKEQGEHIKNESIVYSYLKQTKCHFFSFAKSENRMVEQVLSRGLVPAGGGEWGKGVEG
jgi:hypothetical protein